MAHPYFVKASVFEDIPKLDEERDADLVTRKGEQSDDEIDNLLPSPTITVPLDTVPDIIKIASTKRTKGHIYQDWGETKRGQDLIDQSTADVMAYVKTFKRNTSDRSAIVNITDGTFNDYEHSPLIDLDSS